MEGEKRGNRSFWMWLVTAFIIFCGCSYFIYWFFYARTIETTKDAYVQGNLSQISAQVSAPISSVYAKRSDLVEEGQLLIELDPSDYLVSYENAKAGIDLAVRHVMELFERADEARLSYLLRVEQEKQALSNYLHRKNLERTGALAQEQIEDAETNFQVACLQTEIAKIQLEEAQSQVEGTTVETHPSVEQAKATFFQAALNLKRTKIYSPIRGIIAERGAQVGSIASPGQNLFSITSLSDIWVEANFKETQLSSIGAGERVKLKADLYGGGVTFEGTVYGVAPGTGASFSLLPPQNATGNWIKVVQRVPVIIQLDQRDLEKNPLILGLSMEAKVKLSGREGSLVTEKPVSGLFSNTQLFKDELKEAKEIADQIIRERMNGEE
ncbi:MAG: Multidrug export protein EmrA [Chlamydiales bacterium]|nr:Multidrug export protein EmrA [Chlamydiales bacterium]MCH9619840.1 Multidrug export protein EmrA [Chlamydiales bacterium]MCH9622733.1 Multidrug export protein EmrA [Chlamydiales bacterium]